MWTIWEAYDAAAAVLHLYIVSGGGVPPRPPNLEAPVILQSFTSHEESQRFVDGYIMALAYGDSRVVRSVQCGQHFNGGCGNGGKCSLGFDSYHCNVREGSRLIRPAAKP